MHGETNVSEIKKNINKEAEAPKTAEHSEPSKFTKLIGHVLNKVDQDCVNALYFKR